MNEEENAKRNAFIDSVAKVFFWFIWTIFVSVISWNAGRGTSDGASMREAIREGHASWTQDDNGGAKFKWLPPCKHKTEEPKERKP